MIHVSNPNSYLKSVLFLQSLARKKNIKKMFLPATNVIIKLHKKLILHTEYAYVFVAILVHPYENPP